MSGIAQLIRLCGIAAVVLFAALAVISKTMIEPAGMVIFDSRLAGYTPQDAQAFLAALLPEQRAVYLGLFRWLDTIFPILLAATLVGVIRLNTSGEPRRMRFLALLGPFAYLVFDLMENARVAVMLVMAVAVPDGMVENASVMTQAKWMCLALGLLVTVWAWRFAKKEQSE